MCKASVLLLTLLFFVLLLSGCGPSVTYGELRQKSKLVTTYRCKATDTKTAFTATQVTMWRDGEIRKLKLENQGRVLLLNAEEMVGYGYDLNSHTAIEIAKGDFDQGVILSQMKALSTNSRPVDEAKSTRSEVVDGIPCWVFEMTKNGMAKGYYYDEQFGLLRKMVKGDRVQIFSYDMINSVPDSEFKLPEGMQMVSKEQAAQEYYQRQQSDPTTLPPSF